MIQENIWDDRVMMPWLVYPAAILAIVLLIAAIALIRHRRSSRGAGIIFLVLSIILHVVLVVFLPLIAGPAGGGPKVVDQPAEQGSVEMAFSAFDPDLPFEDTAGEDTLVSDVPLPVAELVDLLDAQNAKILEVDSESEFDSVAEEIPAVPESMIAQMEEKSSESTIAPSVPDNTDQLAIDRWIDEMAPADAESIAVLEAPVLEAPVITPENTPDDTSVATDMAQRPQPTETIQQVPPSLATVPKPKAQTVAATVDGNVENDFAARQGAAKTEAIVRTGGDADTEAAVAAALLFLANGQRADGGWDPQASGAGIEREPLGIQRPGAGLRADTGITGLALLSFLGSGNTHRDGEYADNVYRGLAYLIRTQKTDGSLAGNASIYASTYCHGMAALALCETAAMTKDPSAVEAAKRAVGYTLSMQHPTTGGWRYTKNDPGDLSQLGWQAMVIDSAHRADIPVSPAAVTGIERFLTSVRSGRNGGLASYRAGELPSRTMTAESLATKVLIGSRVSDAEMEEAERYLLGDLPGSGVDNYYYWYYATVALHQRQGDAWERWNDALKRRLLSTQSAEGSWNSDTLWGGYGGAVYTTAMATLCLETYYRHVVRDEAKVARQSIMQR